MYYIHDILVSNILNMTTKMDRPLNPFTYLNNTFTNDTNMVGLLKAIYTASTSPRYGSPNKIILKTITTEAPKTTFKLKDETLENSFL